MREEEEDIVEDKKQAASREQARKREACREILSHAHKHSDCQRFPISPGRRTSINGRLFAAICSRVVRR
jgi:hypothetical protein